MQCSPSRLLWPVSMISSLLLLQLLSVVEAKSNIEEMKCAGKGTLMFVLRFQSQLKLIHYENIIKQLLSNHVISGSVLTKVLWIDSVERNWMKPVECVCLTTSIGLVLFSALNSLVKEPINKYWDWSFSLKPFRFVLQHGLGSLEQVKNILFFIFS